MSGLGVRSPMWALAINDRNRKGNEFNWPFSAWRDLLGAQAHVLFREMQGETVHFGLPMGENFIFSALFKTHQPRVLTSLHSSCPQGISVLSPHRHMPGPSAAMFYCDCSLKCTDQLEVENGISFPSFDSSRLHHSTAPHLYFFEKKKLFDYVNYSCSFSVEKPITPG